MCGEPSLTLLIFLQFIPLPFKYLAVPEVAHNLKFSSLSFCAKFKTFFLSLFLTEIKAVPDTGNSLPHAIWLFAKDKPKFSSIPMTSPVDFISGPNNTSTFGNLLNGKTASFIAKIFEILFSKLNLDASEKQITDKLELARNAYKSAHEEGDSAKILQAQEFLNEAQNDLKSLNVTKQQFDQQPVQQQPQQVLLFITVRLLRLIIRVRIQRFQLQQLLEKCIRIHPVERILGVR